ncbi:hypothetical protein VPH35_069980 [Triticum aestivum]
MPPAMCPRRRQRPGPAQACHYFLSDVARPDPLRPHLPQSRRRALKSPHPRPRPHLLDGHRIRGRPLFMDSGGGGEIPCPASQIRRLLRCGPSPCPDELRPHLWSTAPVNEVAAAALRLGARGVQVFLERPCPWASGIGRLQHQHEVQRRRCGQMCSALPLMCVVVQFAGPQTMDTTMMLA